MDERVKAEAKIDFARQLQMSVDIMVGAIENGEPGMVAAAMSNIYRLVSPSGGGILVKLMAEDAGLSYEDLALGQWQTKFCEEMYRRGFPRPEEAEAQLREWGVR